MTAEGKQYPAGVERILFVRVIMPFYFPFFKEGEIDKENGVEL